MQLFLLYTQSTGDWHFEKVSLYKCPLLLCSAGPCTDSYSCSCCSCQITTVDEAKQFYPLFGLGANVALIFSGRAVKYFSQVSQELPASPLKESAFCVQAGTLCRACSAIPGGLHGVSCPHAQLLSIKADLCSLSACLHKQASPSTCCRQPLLHNRPIPGWHPLCPQGCISALSRQRQAHGWVLHSSAQVQQGKNIADSCG